MNQRLFEKLLEHCNGNSKDVIELLKDLQKLAEAKIEAEATKYYVELDFNDIYAQSKWFDTEEAAINWYKDSFEDGASLDHQIKVHLMAAKFDDDDNLIGDIYYVKTL